MTDCSGSSGGKKGRSFCGRQSGIKALRGRGPYIPSGAGVPEGNEMVQGPFNSLHALALVLRRVCEGAGRNLRPVVMAIELEELEIADEDGEGRLRGPVGGRRFGAGGSGLHGFIWECQWVLVGVIKIKHTWMHCTGHREEPDRCTEGRYGRRLRRSVPYE